MCWRRLTQGQGRARASLSFTARGVGVPGCTLAYRGCQTGARWFRGLCSAYGIYYVHCFLSSTGGFVAAWIGLRVSQTFAVHSIYKDKGRRKPWLEIDCHGNFHLTDVLSERSIDKHIISFVAAPVYKTVPVPEDALQLAAVVLRSLCHLELKSGHELCQIDDLVRRSAHSSSSSGRTSRAWTISVLSLPPPRLSKTSVTALTVFDIRLGPFPPPALPLYRVPRGAYCLLFPPCRRLGTRHPDVPPPPRSIHSAGGYQDFL